MYAIITHFSTFTKLSTDLVCSGTLGLLLVQLASASTMAPSSPESTSVGEPKISQMTVILAVVVPVFIVILAGIGTLLVCFRIQFLKQVREYDAEVARNQIQNTTQMA